MSNLAEFLSHISGLSDSDLSDSDIDSMLIQDNPAAISQSPAGEQNGPLDLQEDLYYIHGVNSSGEELIHQLEDMSPEEDLLIPKIKWLMEARSFSIEDHFNEDHESPIDRVQQVYTHCPGCNQTVYLLKTAIDPASTFGYIKTEVSNTPGGGDANSMELSGVNAPPQQPKKERNIDSKGRGSKGNSRWTFIETRRTSMRQIDTSSGFPGAAPTKNQKKNMRRTDEAKACQKWKFLGKILPSKLARILKKYVYLSNAETTHNEFMKHPRGQKNVRAYTEAIAVTECPATGHLFISPHISHAHDTNEAKYLIIHWDKLVLQTLNDEIWRLWGILQNSVYRRYLKKSCKNRSQGPSIHAGVWSHYLKRPYLTGDSKPNKGENDIEPLDALLSYVDTHLAPLIL
ncbi:hypothetical protein M422DRAFT_43518 [Sphaerobolus stellatus SS14]|nr:hypothetical protein M422DRAFT_43518 [Sphaerobolus stellatus SS14]